MGKIYTINNKILTVNNKWGEMYEEPTPTPTPTPVGAYTLRGRFTTGYTPTMGDSQTLVDSTNNVWDIYKPSSNWANLFGGCSDLIEVVDSNITGVQILYSTFTFCSNLINVPLLDLSTVTNLNWTFESCTKVESGALALYQVASNTSGIVGHDGCFYNCGSNTTSGAAELAQIPSDWK